MRERPILFSAPMVRAIIDGRKTQTRRVVKLPLHFKCTVTGQKYRLPSELWKATTYGGGGTFRIVRGERIAVPEAPGMWNDKGATLIGSPYSVGQRLWVRETWQTGCKMDKLNATQIAAMCLDAGFAKAGAPIRFPIDGHELQWGDADENDFGKWGRIRSSRFMPRWASRITLEVTDVRVQRVQEISKKDAKEEGIRYLPEAHSWSSDEEYQGLGRLMTPISAFAELWDSINAKKYPWASNPWVWAITFRRIDLPA